MSKPRVIVIKNSNKEIDRMKTTFPEQCSLDTFFDFLSQLTEECDHGEENTKEQKRANVSKKLKHVKKELTFHQMIDEFANGSKETFTDGTSLYVYDHGSKSLLVKTEVGTYPAAITPTLLRAKFAPKEVMISREKALELAINGTVVSYETEMFGRKYTGTLTVNKGIPSYKVNESKDIVGNKETIVLGALLLGKWHL